MKNFNWAEDQENAFKDLTKALCNEPVLKYPDFTQQFYLSTDAVSYTHLDVYKRQVYKCNLH